MSEKVAEALRCEADMIKDLHEEGLDDAHLPMTPYQLWVVLDSLAERIDGKPDSSNRWSLHEFNPKAESEESNDLQDKD